MDAAIAAIRERRYTTGFAANSSIAGDFRVLLDALETAQATNYHGEYAEAVAEQKQLIGKLTKVMAKRDAVQAENTRLTEQLEDTEETAQRNTVYAGRLEAERDRLTNQITDLRLYLDKVANTAFGSNSAGLRLLRAEARELLARFSPNEETAEEKKSRCKFCGSTEDGPIGSDGLMICPDCAAEATT